MNLNDELALDISEQDPDQVLRVVEPLVEQFGQLDGMVSLSRKLGIVLGGQTGTYAVVWTDICSQTIPTYDYVHQVIRNEWRHEIAPSVRLKGTALAATGLKVTRNPYMS